ncbi:MAG: hypothetical protein JSU87_01110 [Gemmatimonadota bacterium]|nr:MAG: hypothetical protein JSU87_01110 [Gemmatimonadota bacterium]
MRKCKCDRRLGTLALLSVMALAACGGGPEPMPVAGFGVLSGKTVLVLPVQYVRPVPGGWLAGAAGAREAARQADLEIAFALAERGGRANWVTPEQQAEAVRQRPSIQVNPYLLSADELLAEGRDARRFRDPLYGEVRMLGALFDTRYAVWPLEILYQAGAKEEPSRLAVRAYLLDLRAGTVLWTGLVPGDTLQPPAQPGALAALAQNFAAQVSP